MHILVGNTSFIASFPCKNRLKMMEGLIIKKKKPIHNNINYEDGHNVLVVFVK